MVDCRPGAAAPHDLGHPAHPANGDNHNPQGGPDMGAHALASPAGRAAPPPAPLAAYPGMPVNVNAPYGYGACGVKSLVWCAPPPPPPPPPVNPHVCRSMQPNGADLPMNDIPTLRYYFNLGVECMWAAYGPPRHYSPRDLAQDMQQISLQERNPPHEHGKHKQPDKPPPPPNKGNGQRPLLGPRFKRGNNQDGGQGNHQGKPHNNNNNMPNKGPNNRRGGHEARAAPGYEEAPEPALLPLPYMPYPPPLYPLPYYPVEDPGMLGMVGGMGYVYEEGEPGAPYYAAAYAPPHPLHLDHK